MTEHLIDGRPVGQIVLELNDQFIENGEVVPGLGDKQIPVRGHVHGSGLQALQCIQDLFRRERLLDKGLGTVVQGFFDDRLLADG